MNYLKIDILTEFKDKYIDISKITFEFLGLILFSEDTGDKVVIKDRHYSILYKTLNPLCIELYIYDGVINENKIDYLLNEDYTISDIDLDIFYGDLQIEDYSFNENSIEECDLIEVINTKEFFLGEEPFINASVEHFNLDILFIPLNNKLEPIKNKCADKKSTFNTGISFNDKGTVAKVSNKGLFASFDKVDVILSSPHIIAPKDLESLFININNLFCINFQDAPVYKKMIFNKNGKVSVTIQTPLFKRKECKSIYIGRLLEINNNIYFKYNIKISNLSKEKMLNPLKTKYFL